MGINFAPRWRGLSLWEEDAPAKEEDLDFLAAGEVPVNEPRLPSGQWVLPFAAGGLIECYFVIDCIFGHL